MSQVTQVDVAAPRQARHARALAAVAALLVLCAVALTFALGATSQDDGAGVAVPAQPVLRSDGGPDEARVAAAIGSRSAQAPDESRIASSISVR